MSRTPCGRRRSGPAVLIATLVSIASSRVAASPPVSPADDTIPQILSRPSLVRAVAPEPPRQRIDSAVVTGRVTTEAGVPIPGAVATVSDLRISAITDDAGLYRMVVPPDRFVSRAETLHVTRLGFRPASVPFRLAPGQVTVDVAMTIQAVALDQVVVTGTAGNQERRAQPAVVASIDASAIMAKAPVLDLNELLYARASGVSMTVASGTSGANTRIDIRGQASISLTNYPLVFIDGVRMSAGPRGTAGNGVGGQTLSALNDLNPDDVESIEIVKGPAAATLYGADASAGVIQILTKRGRPGARSFRQKLTVEYDNIDPNFTPYTNYAKCTAALVAPTSTNPLCIGKAVGTVISDNVLVRNNVFTNGQAGSLLYGAQGGGENYGYYASFSGTNEQGTTPSSFLNHRTGRVNFNWAPSSRTTLDVNIGLIRADDRLPKGDQDTYGFLVGGDFGSALSVTTGPGGTLAGGWFVPSESVQSIAAINTEDNTLRATPSVQLHYTPISWFSNRLTMGQDYTRTSASQLYPKNSQNWYSATQNTGQISVTESNATVYTTEYLGNISGRFGRGSRLSSDLSFGSQWINAVSQSLGGTGQGLLTNTNDLVSAATTTTAAQSYSQSKSFGYFAQEQIGLHDRLFVQLGARVDRNSAFGNKVGSFFLPKAGVSYVVSEESFWPRLAPVVSTFRLRAAYGTTGRSPSSTAALQTYSRANYITDGGVVAPGVAPGSPGNPDLKPERGTEFEGGFDAGFFHDRAGIELTYFDKTSRDLLLAKPLAPSSGFASSPLINIGEVTNKGLEIGLRATVVDSRRLSWDVGMQTNTLANKIVSMGKITPFVSGNNQCFKPGLELGAWCVPHILSVDTVARRVTVTDTAVAIGGQLPKSEVSVTTTLSLFRNLRIYAQLDGKYNYKIYNLTRDFRDRLTNSPESVLPAGQGGYSADESLRRFGPFVTRTTGASVGSALVRDAYMVPGGFTRFRELSATLSLPGSLSSRLGVSESSITVGGRNLHLWTRYDGWDPEVNGADGLVNPFRADVFTTPQVRRLFTRLNLQF